MKKDFLKELNQIARATKANYKNLIDLEEEKCLERSRIEYNKKRTEEALKIMKSLPGALIKEAKKGRFSYVVFDTTGYCNDGVFYGLQGSLKEDKKRNKELSNYIPDYPTLRRKTTQLIDLSKDEKKFSTCESIAPILEEMLREEGYVLKNIINNPVEYHDQKCTGDVDDYDNGMIPIGYEIIICWDKLN